MFSKAIRTKWPLFQHSVRHAITGCAISGLDWNLPRHLPNKPGSSNTAATGQVWIGLSEPRECHREQTLALGCAGSLCSPQVRGEQPSWAQPPEGIATHWPTEFRHGITSQINQGHFLLLQPWIVGMHREYTGFYLDSQLIWSGCPYCRPAG